MATTPSGTKFIGTSPSVNTDKRKSNLSNSYQSVSTLSELSDDVKNAQYTIDPSSVGEAVTFTRLDYEDKVDVIIPGILEIARDNNGGGIYNKAAEGSFNVNISPAETYWNSKYIDPVLSGFAKCPLFLSNELTFNTFRNALDGNIGINILGLELIVKTEKRAWLFKFSQWTPGGNGGGFSYTRQEIFTTVIFERPDNATDTVDVISDGLVIKRNQQKGIFNAVLESEYDDYAYQSPLGTEWNSIYTDGTNYGWDDLTNVRKRFYGTWREAIDANPPAAVDENLSLVMHDLSTDLYYAVRFTGWTPNANGGGFAYDRFLIPVNQGIRFSDGTFMDTAPEVSSIDTYYTGIYDLYPYVITPSMIDGSIKIIDTPAAPTAFPYNLISKKISGAVTVTDSASIIYLGTVEVTNLEGALFGPATIKGMVDTYDNNLEAVVDSAFGVGALVSDATTGDLVPMTRMTIVADTYAPNSFDLYLYSIADTENDIRATVSFEYEFLFVEGSEVTFIID
jgi:hypothetical protein